MVLWLYLLSGLSVCSWFSVFSWKSLILWKKSCRDNLLPELCNTSTLNSLWLGRFECSLFSQWKQNKTNKFPRKLNEITLRWRGGLQLILFKTIRANNRLRHYSPYYIHFEITACSSCNLIGYQQPVSLIYSQITLYFTLDRIVHILNRIMRCK